MRIHYRRHRQANYAYRVQHSGHVNIRTAHLADVSRHLYTNHNHPRRMHRYSRQSHRPYESSRRRQFTTRSISRQSYRRDSRRINNINSRHRRRYLVLLRASENPSTIKMMRSRISTSRLLRRARHSAGPRSQTRARYHTLRIARPQLIIAKRKDLGLNRLNILVTIRSLQRSLNNLLILPRQSRVSQELKSNRH